MLKTEQMHWKKSGDEQNEDYY